MRIILALLVGTLMGCADWNNFVRATYTDPKVEAQVNRSGELISQGCAQIAGGTSTPTRSEFVSCHACYGSGTASYVNPFSGQVSWQMCPVCGGTGQVRR